jgi:recombinational DNA repair protein (RecF pathway)
MLPLLQDALAQQRQSFTAAAAAASSAVVSEQNMPADVVLKAAARQGHCIPNDPEQQRRLMRQLTHLHLNGLQLQQLQSLRLCPRLQVR